MRVAPAPVMAVPRIGKVIDSCISFCVRVDAWDTTSLPLRPAHGLRLEIAAATVDRERDCHQLRDSREDDLGCEMTAPLVVFFVLAGLAVIGAVSLILQKHPIHSALSLIVVMVALAGLYLLLGAEFVAAVQIIVYGGAIMVLFVFVIMLLNAGVEERTSISKLAGAAGVRFVGALAGVGGAAARG